MAGVMTMKQIAKELGLSRLTVSSVVNGKAKQRGISDKTIRRVREHLVKRGYVPSRQAVSLRAGRRGVVGILHCGHLFSHLTEAFNRMLDTFSARPDGLEIMVVSRDNLVAGLAELIARGVDHLAWIHTTDPKIEFAAGEPLFALLANIRTAIYNYWFDAGSWDDTLDKIGVHRIGVSRDRAYGKLVAFLKRLGHRTVILPDVDSVIRGDALLDVQFIDRFRKAGMTIVTLDSPKKLDRLKPDYGKKMAALIMRRVRDTGATAVCFRDDELAGYAMAAMTAAGVAIPGELTVTGFDGLRIASAFSVPLTTLRMPVPEMVNQTARVLDENPASMHHCFEMDLVKAQSHARLNAGNASR